MSTKKREKMCDLLRKNVDLTWSDKIPSFQERYPTVSKLKMEVRECWGLHGDLLFSWNFSENDFRYAIDCHNDICYGGGIKLGPILNEIVRTNLTDYETNEMCKGELGSPKGRNRYGYCKHVFYIKVHIEYKEDAIDPRAALAPSQAN